MSTIQAVGRILTPPWQGRLLVRAAPRDLAELDPATLPFLDGSKDQAAIALLARIHGLPSMRGADGQAMGYVFPPFVQSPVAVYEKKQVVGALAKTIDGGSEGNLDMIPLIRPCFLVVEAFFGK